jgi:hypothetical protein
MEILDPCLLSDFEDIKLSPIIKQPYVLIYFLQKPRRYQEVVKHLQKQINASFVSISTKVSDTTFLNIGPLEFLSLMKYADFVCTDSFHGTCFAIKNKKSFIAVPIGFKRAHRITDFLKKLNLSSRFIEDLSDNKLEKEIEYLVNNKIDYQETYMILDSLIKKSRQYLFDAINND